MTPPTKNPTDRKARQFAELRELGIIAMTVARRAGQAAAEAVELEPTRPPPTGRPPAPPSTR